MRKQRMIPLMLLALLLVLPGCSKVEDEMDKMESQMAQKEELTAEERTERQRPGGKRRPAHHHQRG